MIFTLKNLISNIVLLYARGILRYFNSIFEIFWKTLHDSFQIRERSIDRAQRPWSADRRGSTDPRSLFLVPICLPARSEVLLSHPWSGPKRSPANPLKIEKTVKEHSTYTPKIMTKI